MSQSQSLTTYVNSLIQDQSTEFLASLETRLGESSPQIELPEIKVKQSKDAALTILTDDNKLVHYLCTHLQRIQEAHREAIETVQLNYDTLRDICLNQRKQASALHSEIDNLLKETAPPQSVKVSSRDIVEIALRDLKESLQSETNQFNFPIVNDPAKVDQKQQKPITQGVDAD